ncbi:hypothetical protein FACS1894186_2610 [Alphaproteobacteria bacterium]|nr:hypothetical protein FACS1894186_2610 [Alphaproteobacteria bacterium]
MNINSITAAADGLRAAQARFTQAAWHTADAAASGAAADALPADLVDMKIAENSFRANLQILKAAFELQKEMTETIKPSQR